MSALRKPSLPVETLGDRDDLPGVGGILVVAMLAAGLLVALLFMG